MRQTLSLKSEQHGESSVNYYPSSQQKASLSEPEAPPIIRFNGPKVWNSIDDNLKTLRKPMFKKELKICLLESYKYIT